MDNSSHNVNQTATRIYSTETASDSESAHLLPVNNDINEVEYLEIGERMWSSEYIGLYSQYAALGIVFGMSGVSMNFCVYVFQGTGNVCTNAGSIILLPWSFKILYAIFTDSYRPWGMRRKPYMIGGWGGVLFTLLVLMNHANSLTVESWIGLNLVLQLFIMCADVPSDGYLVELSQLENSDKRGQILATAQMIRLYFSVFAAAIQTFFLNGPTTNAPGCLTGWLTCWSFGLTIQQYYGLMFFMVLFLFLPIIRLKELDGSHIPIRSIREFIREIWDTLHSLTSFYLIIFVIGIHVLAQLPNQANALMQYYVIKLTSSQSGIDAITSGLASLMGLWMFTTYWMHTNWRHTMYFCCIVVSLLNFLWLLVYYDIDGLMNPWFTIFIDLDQSFIYGLARIVFSMAVIELAKPGQEATTYELLISIANASGVLSGILATQLLAPMHAIGCKRRLCPSNTVNVSSVAAFFQSAGPRRFTHYTFLVVSINVSATLIFTRFLPKNKDQCHQWNKIGELSGSRTQRGYVSVFLATVVVMYGISVGVMLLNSNTSCLQAVGGSGCT